MNHRRNNQLVISGISLALLLLALPCEWMQLGRLSLGFIDGAVVSVTGLNGSIKLGVSIPLWGVIAVGVTGMVIHGLNVLGVTTLPRRAVMGPLLACAALTLCTLLMTLGESRQSLGAGPFLVFGGVVLGRMAVRDWTLPAERDSRWCSGRDPGAA